MRASSFASLLLLLPAFVLVDASCGSGQATLADNNSNGGNGGQAGDASAGAAGIGGSTAKGGSAGNGGTMAEGGSAGASGQAGGAGAGGSAGQAGNSGSAGSIAGAAGSAGTSGSSGSSGASGSGGTQADAGPGNPCTSDANCSGSTTCQIVPDSNNTQLELRCTPIAGPNSTGVACADNAQCRSGLCVGGYCSTPCSGPNDCTQAGTCKQQAVTIGGLNGSFELCVVEPCSNSKACDPGEVCSEIHQSSTLVQAFCRQSQGAGSPLGADCQAPGDCKSLLCPGWFGTCTEVCSADADCAAMTSGVCVDALSTATSTVQACAQGCSRVADCAAGKSCVISTDTKGDKHRFVCGPPGTAATGSDCSTVNNCASGLCLSNYLNGTLTDQICTEPCVTAADCHGGLTVCTNVSMKPPSGTGSQILSLCDHP